MKRLLLLTLFLVTLTVRADEASEAKTREQLKSAMTQLRTMQTQQAAAQAEQAALAAKNKTLEETVKKQAKSLEEGAAELEKTKRDAGNKQMEQSASIARLESDLARYKASLDKWQAAHTTITGIAKKKEAERAGLATRSADLERKVADLRGRNIELVKIANEILDRYKAYGLGEAISAREPFTGNKRVQLQNIVQDYGDKIQDQTAKP